jgi:hypothetical protein
MKPPEAAPLQAPMTRRAIIKKAVYVTPILLTLPAVPTFAAQGSKKPKTRQQGEREPIFFDGRAQAPLQAPTPRHHEEGDR